MRVELGHVEPSQAASPDSWQPHSLVCLVKRNYKAMDLGFCSLLCKESRAGSLGAVGLAFCQPATPLKVCIHEERQ